MMIHAYDETYVNDSMRNLGEAFDYAINDLNIKPDEFMNMFTSSGYAREFENGNPRIVSGLSGAELVDSVITKTNREIEIKQPNNNVQLSPEYWTGWILAYYQWFTDRTFNEIQRAIPIEDIIEMYYPLHEASLEKFIEVMDRKMKQKLKISKLQRQRKLMGLSQKELAEKSGVNLRTLQQYEIGSKDINKASYETIVKLIKALVCEINDIVE